MFWAYMAQSGTRNIVPMAWFHLNLTGPKINNSLSVKKLNLKRSWILQHDLKYTSQSSMSYLQEKMIKLLVI